MCGEDGNGPALKMYNDNKVDFDEIAKILLSNDTFWQNVKDKDTGTVADIYFTDYRVKQYFPQDQWNKIYNFFNDTKPYDISRFADSVITFEYRSSDKAQTISFLFFTNSKTDKIYYSQTVRHFDQLSDQWYMGYDMIKRRILPFWPVCGLPRVP